MMADTSSKKDRRGFLNDALRTTSVIALAGAGGFLAGRRSEGEPMVWQLDPDQCIGCGHCATYCVLDESAVKCVNCFDMCGFCDICTGYFEMNYLALDTAAENQLCPTGALVRKFIEEKSGQRFYEYTIDVPLCIGCGKCVIGCALMNGSLYMQVEHDRCVDCNECAIAVACPTQAFHRIPASQKEILKRRAEAVLGARGRRMMREAGDDAGMYREGAELLERALTQRRWRQQQRSASTASSEPEGTARDA